MKRKFLPSLAFFLIFLCIIALGSFAVFQAGTAWGIIPASGFWHTAILWKFILLPAILFIATFLGRKVRSKILNFFYIISSVWLGMLLWFFMATVILSIYMVVANVLGIQTSMNTLAVWACIIVLIMTIYGIIHARIIHVKKYEIDSPMLAPDWKDKTMVLVSDIHLGMINGKKFMEKIASKINAEGPDIVFIAGDIIDGPSFDYVKNFAPIGNIKAPLGIYFASGNHEKFNAEQDQWLPILKAYTTVLIDKKFEVNGTQIIGLDYAGENFDATKVRLAKTGYEKYRPSIIMLHDPKNTPALVDMGASLVLSGHTHFGQFPPIKWLVKRMYKKLAYGISHLDKTISIVSSGAGTAVSPMRLGTRTEIVVVKIK